MQYAPTPERLRHTLHAPLSTLHGNKQPPSSYVGIQNGSRRSGTRGGSAAVSVNADTLLAIYLLLLGGGGIAAVVLWIWVARARPVRTPLGPATVAAGVTCFGGAGVLALHLFE